MSEEQPKSHKKWIVLSCASIITILAVVAIQGLAKPAPKQEVIVDRSREYELVAMVEQSSQEIAECTKLIEELRGELEEYAEQPQAAILEKKIEDLTDQLNRRGDEKIGYEERIATLQEEIEELRKQEDDRQEMAMALQRNADLISSLNEINTDYKNTLSALETMTTALQAEIVEVRGERDSLMASASRNSELIQSLQETVTGYKGALNDSEVFVQSVQSELDVIKSDREEVKKEKQALLAAIDEKETRILNLETEVSDLERHFDKVSKLATATNAALEAAKTEGADLKKALNENAEMITSLQEKVNHRDEALRAGLAIEEKNKELLKKEIAKLSQERDQLVAKNSELSHTISSNQEKMIVYSSFEEKFREEKKQRLIKEQLLKQLQAHLDGQRSDLEKVEKSRIALKEELDYTQRSYSKLAEQAIKPTPVAGVQSGKDAQKHIVQQGETLMHISQKYYGTTKKWKHIYEANRDVLVSEDKMQPGLALMIP